MPLLPGNPLPVRAMEAHRQRGMHHEDLRQGQLGALARVVGQGASGERGQGRQAEDKVRSAHDGAFLAQSLRGGAFAAGERKEGERGVRSGATTCRTGR